MTTVTRLGLIGLILASGQIACGDDGNGPDETGISGTFAATTFTATSGAGPVDLLALGATLTMTLAESGTVTGQMVIPDSEFGPGITASMAGTYSQTGSVVTFEQSADTFVRDLPWTYSGNTLTASGNGGGGVTVSVVLTRT